MKNFAKSKGKRITAALLCAVMCIMSLPLSAFAFTAEEGKTVDAYYGDRYFGSDGDYYYSPESHQYIAYDENGNTSLHSASGVHRRTKLMITDSTGSRQIMCIESGIDYNAGGTYNSVNGKNSSYFQNLPTTAQYGIMLTSVYVANTYEGEANVDITRMAAQVVSGIGFLGAGTILREGFSVKGLTTAASLWAVSCIGIAVGAGFVTGAIVATFVIYMTLNSLKKVIVRGRAGKALYIEVRDLAEQVPKISSLIKRTGTVVHSMEILYDNESKFRKKKDTSTIKALIFPKTDNALKIIISNLQADENVVDVYVD